MKLIILESPYAQNVEESVRYARLCMADCLNRFEAPFASHLLYTQPFILDDNIPEERSKGINAGLAWAVKADTTVVYTDLGISSGMELGIAHAKKHCRTVEYRTLYKAS